MRRYCFLLLLAMSQAAHTADTLPPPALPEMANVPATLTALPTSTVRFGEFAMEFERTTLADIQDAVGVGTVEHRGDAGGSQYWLCYTAVSAGKSERIWMSAGPIGGPKHRVDNFYAEALVPGSKESAHCPTLPPQFRRVYLANSLWLGVKGSQLARRFGKPSGQIGDWLFYSYEGKLAASGFDQIGILAVRLSKGRVTGLSMSQLSTD